jgi:acylphosphatase
MNEQQMRLTADVTGQVQGVGFRYRTMAEAQRLGLDGEARNSLDGTVHIVAEGGKKDLERLLGWLRSEHAPGEVAQVDAEFGPPTGEFSGFGVG